MARKNRRKNKSNPSNGTVVNNFDKLDVNVEIDYDKLATAIVKAQCQAEQQQEDSIKNVVKLHRSGLSLLYKLMSWVGYAVSVLLLISLIVYLIKTNWTPWQNIVNNVTTGVLFIGLIFATGLISFILGRSSKEVSEIHDRNLLVSLTSSLVGFLALVIAVVAIFLK